MSKSNSKVWNFREEKPTKAPKGALNAIDKDLFDEMAFEDVSHAKKIAEISDQGKEEAALVEDVFNSFYKMDPKLAEEAPMVQKGLLDQMMQLQEFADLRASTQMDQMSAALGSVQFAPELIVKYKELKKKMEERQKEAQKKGQQGPQSLQEGLSEDEMSSLRQGLRQGLQQAQEKADDYNDTMNGWGVDPGDLQQMPVGDRMQLAERMSKTSKLKNIAELAGRFKNIVNSVTTTSFTHGYDEIVDITMGRDISRVIPSEFAKMKANKTAFFADLLEGKLLQYNLKGVESLGKGPIIVTHDKSGSMGGARDEWATAVTLSLMNLAGKQKRGFGYVAFDTRIMFQNYWPKEQPATLDEKLKVAGIATAGGTNFFVPIKAAFDMRAKEPSLKPADLVFITDGDCGISPEQVAQIKKWREETEVRIYCILIGSGGYGVEHYMAQLEEYCDTVVVLDETGSIDDVKNLLGNAAAPATAKP